MTGTRTQYWNELRIWWGLAYPASFRGLTEILPWLVTLAFVGRLGTSELAALSLVETWMYGFMVITWIAVSMTQNTLVSQAHGARNIGAMRGWGLMSLAAMLLLTAIVTALWVASHQVLIAAGFDRSLVDAGYGYTLWSIPNLWIEAINIPAATYLTSLQRPDLPFYITLLGCSVDISVTYCLVFGAGGAPALGLKGAAIGWVTGAATSLMCLGALLPWTFRGGREIKYGHVDDGDSGGGSEKERLHDDDDGAAAQTRVLLEHDHEHDDGALNAATDSDLLDAADREPQMTGLTVGDDSLLHTDVIATTVTRELRFTRLGPAHADRPYNTSDNVHDASHAANSSKSWSQAITRLKSRRHWSSFSVQLLPNIATTALSQWQLQVLSFLAAEFGTVNIAAHNTSISLFEVVHTAAQGLAEATAVRVGHHLGNGDADAARRTAWLSLAVNCVWALLAACIGWPLRSYMGRIFSDDEAVISVSSTLAPLFWVGHGVWCIDGWALAVLEGQGRASAQTIAYLVGGWCIMLPLAFVSWKDEPGWGLQGLWGALVVGYAGVGLVAGGMVYRSKWDELAQQARERAGSDGDGTGDIGDGT